MTRRSALVALFTVFAAVSPAMARAQRNFDSVQVTAVPVAGSVHMLQGAGGNIGVSAGVDGVFLVDDQYAPLTEKIKSAIGRISTAPIRFVLNTHWHGDHTGGNENFGKGGVLVVAHENVRRRMSVEQFNQLFNNRTPASPGAALPVVTFTDTVTFYLNGDSIVVFHIDPAHTDGDAIVYFRHANVLHAGDTFFNGFYPFIDVSSGGTIEGTIAAADRMLAVANATTKIIPGHGPLATRVELQGYREMLVGVRDRVRRAMTGGKTLEQVLAAKPTADFDAMWGKGFINGETMTRILFTDLSRR